MRMKPAKSDLAEFCDKVLSYEVVELRRNAEALADMIAHGQEETGHWNSFVEAFVLHFRNLWEFLFDPNPKGADGRVSADPCFIQDWNVRPAGSLHGRYNGQACAQVYHTGKQRIHLRAEEQQWPFARIVQEIEDALRLFLQAAPRDSTGVRLRELLGCRLHNSPNTVSVHLATATSTPPSHDACAVQSHPMLCAKTCQ